MSNFPISRSLKYVVALCEEGNVSRSTIHHHSILDIVGSTWFKELYIRDYGGFRFNKMECSKPPEAPSPQVPWPDCRRFQLRFADEPVSSCSSAGHGLRSGQPQTVHHEGKTCLLRLGGCWTGRL